MIDDNHPNALLVVEQKGIRVIHVRL
jgi:hypothetical protein